ncbi:MAG: phenylacetate--CoA ligase family protein [Desulfitobacteriaceae bacterium]
MGKFYPVKNWDRLTQEQIREIQNQKLRYMIKYQVYPYSPYYRRLFDEHGINPDDIRTTDDLVRIPFTTKKDIVSQPEDFILKPTPELINQFAPDDEKDILLNNSEELDWEYKPVHLVFTTGRTSIPTPFYYTMRDLEVFKVSMRRALEIIDANKDDVLLGTMPYAPHIGFWCGYYMSQGYGMKSLLTGGGRVMPTQKLIDLCEHMKASVIHIMTGYVYHFLRSAAEKNRDFSSLRRVFIGGQRVPTGFRNKVLELLAGMGAKDAKVVNSFGFTESKIGAGIECTEGGDEHGYHTLPDLGFFEVINPETGERVDEGETGELVYTPLEMRGTTVIRYRLGDIVTRGITYGPCPVCGRTVPRIGSDISRKTDFKDLALSKVKSTLVNLNAFFTIVGAHPDVVEWQLEIKKRNNDPFDDDELYIYIAPKMGVDFGKLKDELKTQIISQTEISPTEIVSCSIEEILQRLGMETEIKERRIVDLRPAG